MQAVHHNIPGAPYYAPGKYIPDSNTTLDPFEINFNIDSGEWTSIGFIELNLPKFQLYDHVHYIINASGLDAPTLDELISADSFRNTPQVTLPVTEGMYEIYLLGHNATQHDRGYGGVIERFGYFQIDLMPPSGSIDIAGGSHRIFDADTYLELLGVDEESGVASVYIDGEVEDGPDVRNWIPFDSYYDIILASGDAGRRTVTCRFMDNAGNQSNLLSDSILFGYTKYLFYPTNLKNNNLSVDRIGQLLNKTDNKLENDSTNKMSEGEPDGKFREYL